MGSMTAWADGSVAAETWPMIGRTGIPGRLDPLDPAGALIFDTSGGAGSSDAVARFFAVEIGALDWLADFMMEDRGVLGEEYEEPEFGQEPDTDDDQYDKKALTTTATDSGWDL
jgi:hypothetical protein